MDPIRIEGLNFAYGEGELRRPVLRDVSLTVHAGEVVLLTPGHEVPLGGRMF